MVQYRRDYTPGASYFFTVTLRDRTADMLTRHVDLLRRAFALEKAQRPFAMDAVVIMPDHLHAIWTLPETDSDYPARWRSIKSRFVRDLRKLAVLPDSGDLRDRSPWQSRYWEHRLRDSSDVERHVDYIHYNPVKHGLVQSPCDWQWSSLHRYVRDGLLPADWGDSSVESTGHFGE